jgi:hypothetical protein
MCYAGRMARSTEVIVTPNDQARLEAVLMDRNRPLKHVQRARIVLLSAGRSSVAEIAREVGVSRPSVWFGSDALPRRVLMACFTTGPGRPGHRLCRRPWLNGWWR